MLTLPLTTNWQFKPRETNCILEQDFEAQQGWLPASVPGTVHLDLLKTGQIPDPFYGLNEREVQWVGESDWLYQCSFDLSENFPTGSATWLCFDGLDTFATVWLNGQQILTSDNMFIPHRLNVQPLLRPTDNRLQILFESAFRRGEEYEAQYGRKVAWNGAPSRVYVRKAQYHYGWDWGPTLITAGIWQSVRLETYSTRIAELTCPSEVSADLTKATIAVQLEIEAGTINDKLLVELQLAAPDGKTLATAHLAVKDKQVSYVFELANPELWWPNGYGSQPLYSVGASLKAANQEVDRHEKRIGLRRLRLVQEPLQNEPGTTFLFEVNNRPLFCSGANWIPADSFTPRVDYERYRYQLELAVQANMVMLRVWGGGIYEADQFYDICDELGLLVWQDFMFACGIYPALEWFQQSVKAEAEAAIVRLRHHPCIAIWCGNNEDYAIAESVKLYNPAFEGDFSQTDFPARAIYENLLPEVCARLDPTRGYWPGSPYGGTSSGDPTIGDRHTWDVWHGTMADYHEYPKYAGRFVSEFGMASLPDLATVHDFTPPDERNPYSRVLDFHNKADGGQRRLGVYLIDNLPPSSNLEQYIYATQFIQAEALSFALRGWRRKWAGPDKYAVAGALVWQLNDCWPVTSWAIVDYNLNPKPAYYSLRREMATVTLGLWNERAGKGSFWGVNASNQPLEAELRLSTWTLSGTKQNMELQKVVLLPEQATELGNFPYNAEAGLVVEAVLLKDGEIVARATLWPEPFKYLQLPDPEIRISRLDKETLKIEAARPAKGVLLSATGEANAIVAWSDNNFDLLPYEPQIIVARGLDQAEVKVQSLYNLFSDRVENNAVSIVVSTRA